MRRRLQLVAVLFPLAALAFPTLTNAGQWGWSFAPPESHIRFQVTPKDAEIYVDGYYAGRVDEFDGTFQRLHVPPGQHEIVVFLDGYRSLRQHLYLSLNATRTVEGALAKLSPGDPEERRPEPAPEQQRAAAPENPGEPPQPRTDQAPVETRQVPPPPRPAPRPQAPDVEPTDAGATRERTTLATLVVAVSPAGSTVVVDGQKWEGPRGNERLIIQVSEGRHRVEVSRNRYETETVDIDVRAGETRPISVALERR